MYSRPTYNFAAGSFHTKKLCSRLCSREVEFYWHKQRYRVFVPPFGGLRGNVHGSSIARWKARGRFPVSANWTFFASYHGWGAMSRYWGWVTLNANFRGKGASPTNDFWHQKSRVPGLSYGEKKLPKISTGWVGRTNVTDDRQTDRQTERRRHLANVNASSRPLIKSESFALNGIAIWFCPSLV